MKHVRGRRMTAVAGMAYLLGVVFLGVGLALPVGAGTTYAESQTAAPEDCVLAVNWEEGIDPSSTFDADPGYVVCRVVLKVGSANEGGHQMTFTTDGCQGPITNPEGYCVTGIGTGSATGERVCEYNPQSCPALSHAKYWQEQLPPEDEPTETPTEEPTETPTEQPTETPTETPTDPPSEEPPPTATATPTDLPPPPPPPPPTEEPPNNPAPTQPAPTQSSPPQPAPTQTTVSPAAAAPVPVTGGPSPILIPVTGVDFASLAHPAKGLFQNLGLVFLGLGLGMHGLSLRQPREE